LCAADAVYGLQALLEAPESYISSVFQAEQQSRGSSSSNGGGALASLLSITAAGISHLGEKSSATGENDEDDSVKDDFRQQNFMLAHTALSCRSVESSKLMESGIKVAMELKQAIVRVGISIMERKLIVRVKHFRYVSLNIPEREQELFANANVLTQLALFLLSVHRASGKWGGAASKPTTKKGNDNEDGEETEQQEELAVNKSIVPLVLITRNPAQNCFLVVGITCPSTPGEVHRKYVPQLYCSGGRCLILTAWKSTGNSTLGTAFKLAAGETGANFRQDGFTSAVMEIQMDEIQYFVEQLHNVLDA
jgi:cell division control protein 45